MKRILKFKFCAILTILLLLPAFCAVAGTLATPTDLTEPRELQIEVIGGTRDQKGIWHIGREEKGTLHFQWDSAGQDEQYTVEIVLTDGKRITKSLKAAHLDYPEEELPAGTYELVITAVSGGMHTGYGELTLELEEAPEEGKPEEETPEDETPEEDPEDETPEEDPEDETPEEDPDEDKPGDGEDEEEDPDKPGPGDDEDEDEHPGGGDPGGRRPSGGGGRGRGGSGGRSGTITPGKALTSSHASGSGLLALYGTVELVIGDEPMETLVMGGEELELTCGGLLFRGVIMEDMLILTCEETGAEWSMTQKTLKTLYASGIREIQMIDAEEETTLETDLEFSGGIYARARAQGYVSSDFMLCRREGKWSVGVGDHLYDLSELTVESQNGEMI